MHMNSLRMIKTCLSYDQLHIKYNFNVSAFVGFIILIVNAQTRKH